MNIKFPKFKIQLNPSLCLAFFALFFAGCSNNSTEEKKDRKLNVLFVSIDDLGPNLGAYDNEHIVSPNLDEFATTGTTFRRTYCQAAVCAPSRASLMSGLRPDSTRVWHLGDKFRELHPKIVTMPQHFHSNGYRTVCIGKIFHNYMPDSVSWDEPDLRPDQYNLPEWQKRDGETFYVNAETQRKQKIRRDEVVALRPNYYADGWNNGPAWEIEDVHDTMYFDGAQTELAKRTLTRLGKDTQPFFLALGYFRPHLPFAVPKKYWDLYHPDSIPLANNPYVPRNSPVMSMNSMYELRGYDGSKNLKHPTVHVMAEDTARILKQGYYASVSYVDAQFGRILEHLKKENLYDNTIIIVWGDHGWKLGEHNGWCKQTNYNIDIHVPMIVYSPDRGKKGGKTFEITELVDIFPSLCELAGIDAPSYLQGKSFAPLMDDPKLSWKSAAFSQFHRRPKVTPDGKRYMGYSMMTRKYHYVEWYTWNHESGLRGDFVTSELYDVDSDPDENDNVAAEVSNHDLIQKLSHQLAAGWRQALPQQ
jgi:iduronate 2-sulfatase